MTDEPARMLLGLPVCTDGVRLGTVAAVWIDAGDAVLGMEVAGTWNGTTHYLPFAAATLGDRVVSASSLAILGAGPTAFFVERGARRVRPGRDGRFGNRRSVVDHACGDAGSETGDDERHGLD